MMVADTSALMAIHRKEVEAPRFARRIYDDGDVRMAAPTLFEFLMVAAGRRGPDEPADARTLVAKLGIDIAPWDERMAGLALEAFLRFGKGRHRAALNFGDCMSYALAKALDAPLLFKGTDFGLTDIAVASS